MSLFTHNILKSAKNQHKYFFLSKQQKLVCFHVQNMRLFEGFLNTMKSLDFYLHCVEQDLKHEQSYSIFFLDTLCVHMCR